MSAVEVTGRGTIAAKASTTNLWRSRLTADRAER